MTASAPADQQAIREAFQTMTDRTGNLSSVPGVSPDYAASIVRNGPGGRELQRPLPDGSLVVVARGEKQDPPTEKAIA